MKFVCVSLSVALCATTAGAQQVLVVDNAGIGVGPFLDVQPAIDAAQPGDTVLVRPGVYGAVSITRDVALVADRGGVELDSLAITGLPAGSTALVHGVRLASAPLGANGVSLTVSDCDGEVWVQDCDFDGRVRLTLLGGGGIRIANSSDVTLINNVIAPPFLAPFAQTANAIDIDASTVHMFGGSVIGADTSINTGTSAIHAMDSTVVLHDVTVAGGTGATLPHPGLCSDGGDGVVAEGASTIIDVGSRISGGSPSVFCNSASPSPGMATVLRPPATLRTISSAPLRLMAQPVASETRNVDYAITGASGDAVALAFALRPDAFFLDLIESSLLVGPSFIGIPIGSLPSNGSLTVPTVVPELGPGVEVARFYVQVLALRTNATIAGGGGYALTLLDRSF